MIETFGFNTLAILFCVYWSQGLTSLNSLAITLYYKDLFHLDPAYTQYIRGFSFVAWLIKPVYGLISDNIPIVGYHRKSYLFIWGGVGVLSMLSILFHKSLFWSILALFTNQLSLAFCDVIADAIMVEKSRKNETASSALQSFCWIVLSIGGFIGSILGGVLLETLSPKTVIAFSSICPLLIALSSFNFQETPSELKNCRDQVQTLLKAIKKPQILKPLLFIIILGGITPRYSELLTYYMTDVLKFSTTFLGTLSIAAYISIIIGSFIYYYYLKNLEYRSTICIGQLALLFINFIDLGLVTNSYIYLGLPSWVFAISGDVLNEVVSFTFRAMPLLVMSAKICPVGIEGTFYAFFMSVINISFEISGFIGGLLVQLFKVKTGSYDLFWLLVVIQISSQLIPLLFLKLIPKNGLEYDEMLELEANESGPDNDKREII
ncbi:hypothetical protein SteCoe_17760 [Stentor coeruleus]|uniref:Major facilitator superfamily (MFS) profile domain-containing protein n=1 Tax=Stentor coeruleus TaxID=5963 RepID=A0A1R2BY28_9CILI|nr:hypothetical protein SteCoe_17760 [Stentor coeruleus]